MLTHQKVSYTFQLTALWAFVEVTLGGMLHALRVPLTGVVVGGTAVAIISIMGQNAQNPWKEIIKATGLVLLVKAGASPHSPLPAYLAVAFQGVLGALIFQLFKFCRASVILFSLIAMLESGFQKLILMTILYGKSLWTAIDVFTESVLNSFHLNSQTSGSEWIIGIYIGIYTVWGLYLGYRLSTFNSRSQGYLSLWKSSSDNIANTSESVAWNTQRNRNVFWLVYFGILLIMSLILITLGDEKHDLFYVAFRSMSAIFIVFWVINPLFTYWIKKKSAAISLKSQIKEISNQFAFLQQDYFKALHLVGGYTWLPLRYFRAMELLISIKISQENESPTKS